MVWFLDFRSGNLEEARSVFVSLSVDQSAPQAMRDRAREMLSLLDAGRQIREPAVELESSEEEE